MHAGQRYTLKEFLVWTVSDIRLMVILSTVPVVLFELFDLKWLALPWVPIALVGTATAFIVGFRNTQTYSRLWEARQIYGAIVNSSRSWGMMVKDLIGPHDSEDIQQIRRELINRHIAWLTALRFQLREQRAWETSRTKPSNQKYGRRFVIEEWATTLESALKPYLSPEEVTYITGKSNKATQLIGRQSLQLKQLKAQGLIEPLNYVEMERLLVDLFDHQGRSERIKNFPYPRQFATISQMLTRLFIVLVPFGVLNEFQQSGSWMVWLTIPFSSVVGWVFLTLERVGENTENPFEGGANDVPVTAISRTIEIDLLEMIDAAEVPKAKKPENFILS